MAILWKKNIVNLKVDITGKEIGDSVPSPITAKRFCELTGKHLFNLEIIGLANEGGLTINTSNYYTVADGDETQVIFLTGLPVVNGVHLSAMILVNDEFTLIGVND